MINLSQRDPRWAGDKLGESSSTIGRWGCTTTCISMLSDYFECYKSPPEIAHNVNNYLRDLIIWKNLSFEKMRFNRREYGRNDTTIQKALAHLDQGVILEVNSKAHWVVGVKPKGNDYIIVDPWDGQKKRLLPTYHNITGAAFFERKWDEQHIDVIDLFFAKSLAKREYPFFLQTEEHGEIWYIHPSGEREYISKESFLPFMQEHAIGITNADLSRIPIKK